jgi:hypothetical protein
MKNRIPSIETALKFLRPNVITWELYNTKFTKWEDPTDTEPPSWEELSLQIRKDYAIWEYYEYSRKREEKYGDIGDQLDIIYNDIKSGNLENGKWVKHVESVKNAIPKPIELEPDVDKMFDN